MEITKFYTGILMILPILNIYGSFIPSVEIGTFLILLLSLVFLGSGKIGSIGYDKLWIWILVVFLICTSLSIDYNPEYSFRYFARYLKIVVIVLVLVSFGKKHYNHEYALRFFKKSSIVCSFYMFIQYVFYFVGVKLPGVFAMVIPAAVQGDDSVERVDDGMFRPSSFFIEPSNYAAYQIILICYLLSHPTIKKRKMLFAITLLGLFLSTSGTGYITTIIVILASAFICGNKMNSQLKGLVVGIVGLLFLVALVMSTSVGQQSIGRFVNSDGTIGMAATGRLTSGAELLFLELPTTLQWIGCGFGYRPEDAYFSSLYAILYGDGIIGLLLIIVMMVYYYRHTSNFGKLLCLTYSVLFVGTGTFNFAAIGLYFSLISAETIIYQRSLHCKHISKAHELKIFNQKNI